MIIKLSKIKYKKLIKEFNKIICYGDYSNFCDEVSNCDNHNTINRIKKLLKIKNKNEK